MNLRRSKKVTTDVVAQLKHRTQQAQALDSIPRQDLLADPRLNPETRALADELTARRLRTELELEHKRRLRRERERDRIEERAARRAAAIDDAREATSDDAIVLDMTRSRKRFVAGALAASIVCSVGSAVGVENAAQLHTAAPAGMGYFAEVAMTGMSTMAIAWKGGLLRGRAVIEALPHWALITLITVPLVASIVASTAGAGAVGAACSLGAAAFAWFAYLVSSTGAVAITQAVTRMDTQQRTHTTVTETLADNEDQEHEELPPLPRRADRDALEVVGEEIAQEAADFLRDHGGDERGDDASSPGGDDGSTGDVHPSTDAPPALEDAARRRSQTARQRVEDYYENHPDAPVKAAARELGVDPKTVRKYRPGGGAARG